MNTPVPGGVLSDLTAPRSANWGHGLGKCGVGFSLDEWTLGKKGVYTSYTLNVGFAQYSLGNYAQAIESLEKAQERNENAIPIKMILAASYVRANRMDDAEWAIEQIQVLNPATTLSHTTTAMTLSEPKLKEQLLNDLRKAGLPE